MPRGIYGLVILILPSIVGHVGPTNFLSLPININLLIN